MRYLLSLFFAFSILSAFAQSKLRVTRSTVVDWNLPVNNLFVDADNNKWVANEKGVSQVLAYNLSKELPAIQGEISLLAFPGGNANLSFSESSLNTILSGLGIGTADITAAHLLASANELWLGTAADGLLQLSLSGSMRLVKQHLTTNSKLKSDVINSIFEDRRGRLWIATGDGALVGKGKDWELIERYFNIEGFAENSDQTWMFGEGFIGPVNSKLQWNPVELPTESLEGILQDFTFDWDGNIWLASEIVARYNFETEELLTFGGAEYYTSSFPVQIEIDLDEAIWVSTLDKGLFVIEESTALNVRCFLVQGIGCDGDGKDAIVEAEVVGGEAPYGFEWSNGATKATLEGIAGGSYKVLVTDAKGQTKSADIEVKDPRVKMTVAQVREESSPGSADGEAQVLLPGNAPGYEISWSNGASTPVISGLEAGDYSVSVTNTEGCTAIATVKIQQKSALLNAKIELVQSNSCFGAEEAILEAKVGGGKEPYSLNWRGIGGSEFRKSGLKAGNYLLQVIDAEGTVVTTEFLVEDPQPIVLVTELISAAGVGENNGSAIVKAEGGTPGYTYLWDNGNTISEAANLGGGMHQVTLTDANGCSQVAEVEIPENVLSLSVAFIQENKIICAGEATASLSVKVNGGKGPMSFQWSDGESTAANRDQLPAGIYTVTVTDALGSTAQNSYTIPEPEALNGTLSVLNQATTGQANGRAEIIVSGGNAPYTILWDNGVRESQALRLSAGPHSVTVTDRSNCTLVQTIEIPENILPLAANITEIATNNCPGQSNAALNVTATGGKQPYEIAWSDAGLSGFSPKGLKAGSYTATITDATGSSTMANVNLRDPEPISLAIRGAAPATTGKSDGKANVAATGGNGNYTFAWDNGEQVSTATQLAPGEHSVTVTDAAGCSAETTVTIEENILPLAIELSLLSPIVCNGDPSAAIAAKLSGGKEPYAITWNNGATGFKIQSLKAGRYTANATDASGQEVSKTIEIREAAPLQLTIVQIQPASANQSDGLASATVSGGVPPFTYSWDTGATTDTISGLAPGTYRLTLTDAAGCVKENEIAITENVLPLAVNLEVEQSPLCYQGNEGSILASFSGGKTPFNISWSTGATGDRIENLSAGEYGITVTDAAEQSSTASLTLTEPELLVLNTKEISPASTDKADGSAKVMATGGTEPYEYRWSNGLEGTEAEALEPGVYSITVTDARTCTAGTEIEITENILPLKGRIALMALIDCSGNENAAVRIVQEGGKGPFTYQWSNPELEGTELSNLGPGEYTVTISDASGQSISPTLTIREPSPLQLDLLETRSPSEPGLADGKATVQIAGGTAPYKIRWQNGEESVIASQLPAGNTKVFVFDAKSCRAELEVSINERILTELIPASLRPGQTIRMRSLEFEADSSRITPESIPVLEELYGFLKDNPEIAVEIGGHTNNIPSHEYCDSLSTARARAIAEFIVRRGVPADRVQYYGYGKRNPIFSNQTEDGRQRNQRVEIKILRLRDED